MLEDFLKNSDCDVVPDKDVVAPQVAHHRWLALFGLVEGVLAVTLVIAIPQEVADTALEIDTRECRRHLRVVNKVADVLARKHRLSELVHTTAASQPPGRDHHSQKTRIQLQSLLYKEVVDGG